MACVLACLAAALTGLVAASARAAEPAVVIVTSERSAPYLEATAALEDQLARSGVSRTEVAHMTSQEFMASAAVSPRLFIAVGTQAGAMMAARDSRVPLLLTLLPLSAYEQITQGHGRKGSPGLAAVLLDQPFARQLDLIRLAMPSARRIGLLWGSGPNAQAQPAAWRFAAQARGLQLVQAQVATGEPIYPALQKLLEDCEVLLAVPNAQVFNSANIQNILLTSFRSRVPLIGFSASYVGAGAVMALYSTPAMVGHQTALLAQLVLSGRNWPGGPQYPHEFVVGVNAQVARALGLQLDATALSERLKALEANP